MCAARLLSSFWHVFNEVSCIFGEGVGIKVERLVSSLFCMKCLEEKEGSREWIVDIDVGDGREHG